jgi:hypothetical protein
MMDEAESVATLLHPWHRGFDEAVKVALFGIPQRYGRTLFIHFVDVYSMNIVRITM